MPNGASSSSCCRSPRTSGASSTCSGPDGEGRMTQVLEDIFDVRGARALVTGAASGLGFAFAEVLADCGAHVTLTDVDEATLQGSTQALADRGLSVRSAVVD